MTQIYFEDIELGYEISPVVKQPSHEELLAFCAVTHLTGRFVSEEGAHVDGLERVILSSWQSGAYLAQLLTSWMGAEGKLSSFDIIFRGLVELGDRLECHALVTDTLRRENDHVVVLDTYLKNQRGERPVQGTAEIVLPSKNR